MIAAPAPVGVVLVNWNRWRDTVEALESLLHSTVPVRIIVVDNASADGSLDQIEAWARGDLVVEPASPAMARFSSPAWPKPVALRRIDVIRVEARGFRIEDDLAHQPVLSCPPAALARNSDRISSTRCSA